MKDVSLFSLKVIWPLNEHPGNYGAPFVVLLQDQILMGIILESHMNIWVNGEDLFNKNVQSIEYFVWILNNLLFSLPINWEQGLKKVVNDVWEVQEDIENLQFSLEITWPTKHTSRKLWVPPSAVSGKGDVEVKYLRMKLIILLDQRQEISKWK